MSSAGKHKPGLSDRLPTHKPDRDLWAAIGSGLDAVEPEPLGERLPVHSPARDLWLAISAKIAPWYSPQSQYFKGIVIGLAFLLMLSGWWWSQNDVTKFVDIPIAVEPASPQQISSQNENTVSSMEQKVLDTKPGNEDSYSLTSKNPASGERSAPEIPDVFGSQPAAAGEVIAIAKPGDGSDEQQLDKVSARDIISVLNQLGATPIFGQPDDAGLQKLPTLSAASYAARMKTNTNSLQLSGSKRTGLGYKKDVLLETGLFVRPTFIKHVSTISDDWVYSPGAGVSLAMVQKQLILETGISYSKLEFEDKIDIDYYAYVFLGTVLSTNPTGTEEYVNDEGDTLVRITYQVQLIDVYDSTFVEEEKNDIVKTSSLTIPLTVGYRLRDDGRFFYDLKAGLDMMIVTGRVIPGNPTPTENIKVMDVENSLAEKYSLKWKYHLSVGVGLRLGERVSLYAEPTMWLYPEGIRNKETREIKNPVEAGLRFGLRWGF